MRNHNFARKLFSVFLCLFLASASWLQAEPSVEEGKKLFRGNCASCHKVVGQLVGPQLKGVSEKYANDKEWLYEWVRNSQKLIKAGDEKAVALYEQYNKQAMTAFPNLTDENIESILAWVDAEVAAAAAPPTPPPGTLTSTGGAQDPLADPTIFYALLGLVGVLVLIALLLVVITASLVTAVRAKENEEPFRVSDVIQKTQQLLGNKFVVTAIVLIAIVASMVKGIDIARGSSLQQGYQPEQPIKFSHKLHAGQYKIDCQYCHTGVTKSKNAWVPSVNICMNCHKAIQEGPKYGTEEINKILTAWENKEEIEWVRIHNLPDHAYFNHAQHVVVGGLECQNCHGAIEEMEVVYQYSNLGMGWCVNCHRESKVKVLGKETDMTVEDMGGLNCARCHY
ncbi:MAG: c-type cytochrome [Bacteroidota bacterium]